MASPTPPPPPPAAATQVDDCDDDPLTQAMSMLDSLGGGGGDGSTGVDDFEDFAIDSEDEVDLNDLEDGLEDVMVDVDDDVGGGDGDDDDGVTIDRQLSSEIDGLRDNLQGRLSTDDSNCSKKEDVTAAPGAGSGAPPTHWATKQDVTEFSNNNDGGGGAAAAGGGAVNSTTATSLHRTANPTIAHPLVHPLQDIPTANSSSNIHSSAPSPPLSTTAAAGGWTSSFASFASRAAASVQSAVENAEAAVLQGGSAGGGSGAAGQYNVVHGQNPHQQQQQQYRPQQQQQQQQQQHSAAAANAMTGAVGVQGGAATQQPMTSKSIVMSYQERQKLLHQQYHANNNNNNGSGGIGAAAGPSLQKPPTPRASPATVASTPLPSPTTQSAPSSPHKITNPTATSTTATTAATAAAPPPTFLDKLTSALDTPTKTKLISSALGKLLPGERVIMFLNSLKDVRDSAFNQIFVGSDELLVKRGLGEVLGGGNATNNNHGGMMIDGGGENGEGNPAVTAAAGVTTVWCCVMTFYRVAVFSYQATLDGKILLDDDEVENEGHQSNIIANANNGNSARNEVISQWIHSQNVSIQFQAAHYDNHKQFQQKHHVFQMPLASIERVEKTLASSQKSMGPGGSNPSMTASSNSSYYSNTYNALLPSPSTVSSTASSAMVSLVGSQMKPLLGGIGSGSSSNSNLLTNGGGGSSHNNTNLAEASANNTPTGPMGIILHGKDGGRWMGFSTSSYGDAQRAQEALNTYAFPGRRNLGYLFAFESRRAEVMASNTPPQAGQPVAAAAGGRVEVVNQAGGGAGNPIVTAATPTKRRFVPLEEYERQGIFQSRGGGPVGKDTTMTYSSPWAPILNANANYGLCSTYPSVLVGPRSIVGDGSGDTNGNNGGGPTTTSSSSPLGNDNIGLLRRCAAFRSENRFPALTWGTPHHGGSIWRSSQPKVGLQGNRSMEDERYLYAIGEEAKRANLAADARAEGGVGGGMPSRGRPPVEFLRMLCGRNNEGDLIMEGGSGGGSNCMLKIMDMRPKSAAMGNRTQGYGYENTNNYRGTTINFYGIGNIHAVRDAYQKVNSLCLNPNTNDIQWMQLVENTNWPSMIRLILSASWQTAFHVHYNRLPVLVHCSVRPNINHNFNTQHDCDQHGWDRTSQVPALSQLLLDPHYRTRKGFSTLVEKDFLSFGHPFHTRCGHGEGKNEQGGGDEGQLSPIFLQFLDCVFQLVNQFPDYFEFNTRYVLLLSEHIYSCRFGTLLCDSEREREVVAGIRQRTYCMWECLDSIPELVNPMFDKAASDKAGVLLMPLPMLLRNVTLWTDRYCMYGAKATMPCMPPSLHHSYPPLYTAQCPKEQLLVLHTIRNGVEGPLHRALDDVDMWKETALAALKE
ncbi:hypothetical protein ACHAXR_007096, partial [Thalassiosira sp. AJA248-18]